MKLTDIVLMPRRHDKGLECFHGNERTIFDELIDVCESSERIKDKNVRHFECGLLGRYLDFKHHAVSDRRDGRTA